MKRETAPAVSKKMKCRRRLNVFQIKLICAPVTNYAKRRNNAYPVKSQSEIVFPAMLIQTMKCLEQVAEKDTRKMSLEPDVLISQIRDLEHQLEAALAIERAKLGFRLADGRAHFEREIELAHRALRTSVTNYFGKAALLNILTAPVIYSLIIPFVLIDFWVTAYQVICFPIYKISVVKRHDYLVFDRSHLRYLNLIEKLNCAYCSYCNGLIGYIREIAAQTEKYWCPIKHARRVIGAHYLYREFSEYGDSEGFHKSNSP